MTRMGSTPCWKTTGLLVVDDPGRSGEATSHPATRRKAIGVSMVVRLFLDMFIFLGMSGKGGQLQVREFLRHLV